MRRSSVKRIGLFLKLEVGILLPVSSFFLELISWRLCIVNEVKKKCLSLKEENVSLKMMNSELEDDCRFSIYLCLDCGEILNVN